MALNSPTHISSKIIPKSLIMPKFLQVIALLASVCLAVHSRTVCHSKGLQADVFLNPPIPINPNKSSARMGVFKGKYIERVLSIKLCVGRNVSFPSAYETLILVFYSFPARHIVKFCYLNRNTTYTWSSSVSLLCASFYRDKSV